MTCRHSRVEKRTALVQRPRIPMEPAERRRWDQRHARLQHDDQARPS